MKTKKLIKKYYKSIVGHRKKKIEKFYRLITKKSLKGKHTEVIQ
jgi:hypothetical protein